jgi:hypothetical protein
MKFSYERYGWAKNEDVLVTLIEMDAEDVRATYLVQRTEGRSANPAHDSFVVQFLEEIIKVNGVAIDMYSDNWPEILCNLADSVALAPRPQPGDSVTTRYEP